MLEDILKKESLDLSDLEVIFANLDKLSDKDLIRLGLKVPEPVKKQKA